MMQLSTLFRSLIWGTLLFGLAGCNPESDGTSGANVREVSTENLTCRIGICTLDSGVALDDEDAELVESELELGDVILKAAADQELVLASAIEWNTEHSLTLQASNDIRLAGGIAATAGKLIIDNPGFDYIALRPINLSAGDNFRANDKEFIVITSLGSQNSTTGTDLQGIEGNLNANYALGADIDASDTHSWGSTGFLPLGTSGDYSGTFDGLGHTISNLKISRNENYIALFKKPVNTSIRHLALQNAAVNGKGYVAAFAGQPSGSFSIIRSCVVGGSFAATGETAGGFMGSNSSTNSNPILDSCILGSTITGQRFIGGIAGLKSKAFQVDKNYLLRVTLGSTTGSNTMGVFADYSDPANVRDTFYQVGISGGALRGNTSGGTAISVEQSTSLSTFTDKNWDVSTDPNGTSLWYMNTTADRPVAPMLRSFDIDIRSFFPIPI